MIRLSKTIVGEQEISAVKSVMEVGYLGMGQETQRFEQDLVDYIGGDNRHVVCVNSGTAALHLALQAIGVGVGDEVLVPSLTFVASFQPISAIGAVPVACDVCESNALLDLADAEKRITSRTKAIMPVHYASYPGNLQAIYEFAKKHNLRVVEDAAHAFGCVYKDKRIGSFGDVVCFSFDGIKNITSGEGGAVVSSDMDVIQRVQDARLLGVEKDSDNRYKGQRSWEFDVNEQGYRYHMSDIMAAIGRVQLQRFEKEFKPKRQQLASYYRQLLSGVSGIKLFETDLDHVVSHILPIRVLNDKRDGVRKRLLENNIQSGIHYKPNHLLSKYGGGEVSLPVSEQLYLELLSLPLHPGLTKLDIDRIVNVIKNICGEKT
jgi:dTDP-4-amino-4,6-dideoxygalactose transaminase